MKNYNTPVAEVVELQVADIITLSVPDANAANDDVVNAPRGWFNFLG